MPQISCSVVIWGGRREAAKGLYEIAEDQEAKTAGFAENTYWYHIQAGNWIRELRGIYRVTRFPRGARPDLILCSLWSKNREEMAQGAYSHQTDLSLLAFMSGYVHRLAPEVHQISHMHNTTFME
jgi:hypothetical protein